MHCAFFSGMFSRKTLAINAISPARKNQNTYLWFSPDQKLTQSSAILNIHSISWSVCSMAVVFVFSNASVYGFRPHYYVSCWHMNVVESAKMWHCYTKTPEAVAVATTYRALRASLPAYVEIGMVRYIDYSCERLPSLNLFEYVTHKNINFCFEREVRAVALPPATEGLGAAHFQASQFESETQKGFRIFAPEIDISNLIHRVVFHPESSPEFAKEISSTCKGAGLPSPSSSELSKQGGCRVHRNSRV